MLISLCCGPAAPSKARMAAGSLGRLVFAAVLARYFWASALTKIDGAGLSLSAYAQIFPRQMEAVGYDPSGLAIWVRLVVFFGTAAEFLLPALIIAGLATRAASVMMIGFILVMTATDIVGHGVGVETMGQLFDRDAEGVFDQRLLWGWLLATLALCGGGWLSVDQMLRRYLRPRE